MKFTTEIAIERSEHPIRVADKMLLMGSCFAQEMGQWFLHRRFDVNLNPNGILFHPMVIARCLNRALLGQAYRDDESVSYGGLYHSFDFHGSFSCASQSEHTEVVNAQLKSTNQSLSEASTLVLTWGSAWGYKWNEQGQWVSNCHKIPQSNFTKELITAGEIVSEYQELLNEVWNINPNLEVIITVSPVRYWRDGAHGNQLSKAHLLLAASQLATSNKRVHYFPSYEIMMDELRDYRFYNADMLHPTPQAVEFIIGKFQEMFFTEESKRYISQVEPIRKFLGHRPLHLEESEWMELCSAKEKDWMRVRQLFQ
jgi:hypothetical protein